MNTAVDKQGGADTASPLEDLPTKPASDGTYDRARDACIASWTTTINNTPSKARAGHTNYYEQHLADCVRLWRPVQSHSNTMLDNSSTSANVRHIAD